MRGRAAELCVCVLNEPTSTLAHCLLAHTSSVCTCQKSRHRHPGDACCCCFCSLLFSQIPSCVDDAMTCDAMTKHQALALQGGDRSTHPAPLHMRAKSTCKPCRWERTACSVGNKCQFPPCLPRYCTGSMCRRAQEKLFVGHSLGYAAVSSEKKNDGRNRQCAIKRNHKHNPCVNPSFNTDRHTPFVYT